MKKSLFFFFLYAFLYERIYLISDNYFINKILTTSCLYIFFLCVLFYFFTQLSYKKIEEKFFWLFFIIYLFGSFCFYLYCQFKLLLKYDYNTLSFSTYKIKSAFYLLFPKYSFIQNLLIPFLFFILFYIIYIKIQKLNICKTDKIEKDNVYLVFRYPNNLLGLIISIFWKYPVSTIFFYHNNIKYGFNRRDKKFIKETYKIKNISNYFFKKCNNKDKDKILKNLNSFLGTKWSIRKNCLTFYKHIL